jgi:hypothetical protein
VPFIGQLMVLTRDRPAAPALSTLLTAVTEQGHRLELRCER